MDCLGKWAVLWAVDLRFCFHLNKSVKNEDYNYRNHKELKCFYEPLWGELKSLLDSKWEPANVKSSVDAAVL